MNRNKETQSRRKLWLLLLLCYPVSAVLLLLPSMRRALPNGTPRVLMLFYPAAETFSGLFPFSIAELLVVICPILAIVWIAIQTIRIVRTKKAVEKNALGSALRLLCAGGIIFLLFTTNCGINYSRATFAETCGLPVQDSSQEELQTLCVSLTQHLNELRPLVSEDENGIMELSSSFSSLGDDAQEAFDTLSAEYPLLTGGYSRPKEVLLSRLMSWCNITGVFFPFTFEANVNSDIPDYSIPSTMCHELSHLRGFMREDEANFIGYLACCRSDNADLRYSGYMLAFIHANNALYSSIGKPRPPFTHSLTRRYSVISRQTTPIGSSLKGRSLRYPPQSIMPICRRTARRKA